MMGIPDKINCPICNNQMTEIKPEENPELKLSNMSIVVKGERKFLMSKLFICEKCTNIQTFMKGDDNGPSNSETFDKTIFDKNIF